MARYKTESTTEEVINTLSLLGHSFIEVWEDGGTCCRKPILSKVEDIFPDLPDEVLDAIDSLCESSNPCEIAEMLSILEEYEHSR